jgi:two-component sensor histidine kinase
VKNNLQLVHSLVRMAGHRAPVDAKSLLDDTNRRIWAIGQLHERIYAGKDLAEIDLAAYLGDIADEAAGAFGDLRLRAQLTRRLQPITVDVNTALPIGLIATELLTNAYKYAFPDERRGEIRLELSAGPEGIEFVVADDGVGLRATPGGSATGLRLVRALAKQVGGTLTMDGVRGTCATLRFVPRVREREAA